MPLKDEIRACTKCPLYKNMELSPVAPEWTGHPDLMIINGSPMRDDNDLMQEVITGVSRTRFIQLLAGEGFTNYYISPLVKCRAQNCQPSKKDTLTCVNTWIMCEIQRLGPLYIIACGPRNLQKYVSANDYSESIRGIVQSIGSENQFKEKLQIARAHINAIKSK